MEQLLSWLKSRCEASQASAVEVLAPTLAQCGLLDNRFDVLALQSILTSGVGGSCGRRELSTLASELQLDAASLLVLLESGIDEAGGASHVESKLAFKPELLSLLGQARLFLWGAYALATLRDLPPAKHAVVDLTARSLWRVLLVSRRRLRLRGFLWLMRELRVVPRMINAKPAAQLFHDYSADTRGSITVTTFCYLLLSLATRIFSHSSTSVPRTPVQCLSMLLEFIQEAAVELAAGVIRASLEVQAYLPPPPSPHTRDALSPLRSTPDEIEEDSTVFAALLREGGMLDNVHSIKDAKVAWKKAMRRRVRSFGRSGSDSPVAPAGLLSFDDINEAARALYGSEADVETVRRITMQQLHRIWWAQGIEEIKERSGNESAASPRANSPRGTPSREELQNISMDSSQDGRTLHRPMHLSDDSWAMVDAEEALSARERNSVVFLYLRYAQGNMYGTYSLNAAQAKDLEDFWVAEARQWVASGESDLAIAPARTGPDNVLRTFLRSKTSRRGDVERCLRRCRVSVESGWNGFIADVHPNLPEELRADLADTVRQSCRIVGQHLHPLSAGGYMTLPQFFQALLAFGEALDPDAQDARTLIRSAFPLIDEDPFSMKWNLGRSLTSVHASVSNDSSVLDGLARSRKALRGLQEGSLGTAGRSENGKYVADHVEAGHFLEDLFASICAAVKNAKISPQGARPTAKKSSSAASSSSASSSPTRQGARNQDCKAQNLSLLLALVSGVFAAEPEKGLHHSIYYCLLNFKEALNSPEMRFDFASQPVLSIDGLANALMYVTSAPNVFSALERLNLGKEDLSMRIALALKKLSKILKNSKSSLTKLARLVALDECPIEDDSVRAYIRFAFEALRRRHGAWHALFWELGSLHGAPPPPEVKEALKELQDAFPNTLPAFEVYALVASFLLGETPAQDLLLPPHGLSIPPSVTWGRPTWIALARSVNEVLGMGNQPMEEAAREARRQAELLLLSLCPPSTVDGMEPRLQDPGALLSALRVSLARLLRKADVDRHSTAGLLVLLGDYFQGSGEDRHSSHLSAVVDPIQAHALSMVSKACGGEADAVELAILLYTGAARVLSQAGHQRDLRRALADCLRSSPLVMLSLLSFLPLPYEIGRASEDRGTLYSVCTSIAAEEIARISREASLCPEAGIEVLAKREAGLVAIFDRRYRTADMTYGNFIRSLLRAILVDDAASPGSAGLGLEELEPALDIVFAKSDEHLVRKAPPEGTPRILSVLRRLNDANLRIVRRVCDLSQDTTLREFLPSFIRGNDALQYAARNLWFLRSTHAKGLVRRSKMQDRSSSRALRKRLAPASRKKSRSSSASTANSADAERGQNDMRVEDGHGDELSASALAARLEEIDRELEPVTAQENRRRGGVLVEDPVEDPADGAAALSSLTPSPQSVSPPATERSDNLGEELDLAFPDGTADDNWESYILGEEQLSPDAGPAVPRDRQESPSSLGSNIDARIDAHSAVLRTPEPVFVEEENRESVGSVALAFGFGEELDEVFYQLLQVCHRFGGDDTLSEYLASAKSRGLRCADMVRAIAILELFHPHVGVCDLGLLFAKFLSPTMHPSLVSGGTDLAAAVLQADSLTFQGAASFLVSYVEDFLLADPKLDARRPYHGLVQRGMGGRDVLKSVLDLKKHLVTELQARYPDPSLHDFLQSTIGVQADQLLRLENILSMQRSPYLLHDVYQESLTRIAASVKADGLVPVYSRVHLRLRFVLSDLGLVPRLMTEEECLAIFTRICGPWHVPDLIDAYRGAAQGNAELGSALAALLENGRADQVRGACPRDAYAHADDARALFEFTLMLCGQRAMSRLPETAGELSLEERVDLFLDLLSAAYGTKEPADGATEPSEGANEFAMQDRDAHAPPGTAAAPGERLGLNAALADQRTSAYESRKGVSEPEQGGRAWAGFETGGVR